MEGCVCVCVCTAYLGDVAGSVLDDSNKENIAINTQMKFLVLLAYKGYVYIIL